VAVSSFLQNTDAIGVMSYKIYKIWNHCHQNTEMEVFFSRAFRE